MIVTLKDGSKKEYAEAKSVTMRGKTVAENPYIQAFKKMKKDLQFSAIQHPTYLPRQYRPYSRMQRLLSDLLLIQDSTMISTALHSPVMTWMQSKKK